MNKEKMSEFEDDYVEAPRRDWGADIWSLFWRYCVSVFICMAISNQILKRFIDFNSPEFVMLKPSILGLGVAAIFISVTLFNRQGIASYLVKKRVGFNDSVWIRFNFSLIFFELLLSLFNFIAILVVDEESWVKYKLFVSPVFGLLILSVGIVYSLKAQYQR